MLHRHQQVLDQYHVLLLREGLQVGSLLIQGEHGLPLGGNLSLEFLVVLDLHEDGLHHPGDRLQVAEHLLSLDDLPAGIIESVHTGLMGLDVVDANLELGKLDLDDLWVAINRLQGIQGLV